MGDQTARWSGSRRAAGDRLLPTGDVTFLFTDIEASTVLMDRAGEAGYAEMLAQHDDAIRAAVQANGGTEVDAIGDGMLVAFARPLDAMAAAVTAQESLQAQQWPHGEQPKVRMGLHRGRVAPAGQRDYVALAIHQAARVASAPHGGQIICTDALLVDVADASAVGLDTRLLGVFWLRDFADPVRVYQVERVGVPQDYPPLRAVRADFTNVVRTSTELVGRRSVLADLGTALAVPGLVSIIGPGGVGKTRVAIEHAVKVAANGEAAWIVELATVRAEDDNSIERAVAATIARALGSVTDSITAVIDGLSNQHALLVLDNCEHVADAVAPIVESLLAQCPQLRILVTSRESLRVVGEQVVPLLPLGVPDPQSAGLDEIAAAHSVRLFCQRATAGDPQFALTADNATDVAELCRELDGLPLALELAAAATRYLTPPDLLRRLREIGDLPGTVGHRIAGRHSSLDNLVTWSLDSCTDVQAAVFRRLGAFAGPASLDAAVAVCGGASMDRWDVADAIGALVEKSLVNPVRDGTEVRYDLLVTLRRAALSHLQSAEESREALLRHAAYIAETAAVLDEECGMPFQISGKRLVAELDVVLDRAAAIDLPTPIYAAIACCRTSRLWVRNPRTAIDHCAALLARPDLTVADRARVLRLRADISIADREPESEALIEAALVAARESGDPTDLVSALIHAAQYPPGRVETTSAEDPVRAALLAEALRLLPQVNRLRSSIQIRLYTVLGAVAAQWGRPAEAREYHQQSLTIAHDAGDVFNEGVATYNLAEVDELTGNLEAAAIGFGQAAKILGAPGTPPLHRTSAMYSWALLISRTRPPDEAIDAAADALLSARQGGLRSLLVPTLLLTAEVARGVGDPTLTRSACEEVLEISTDPEALARATTLLAGIPTATATSRS